MITISNRQSGSAHLVIISVLTAALVVALGFIFWNNILKPSNDESKSQESTASALSSSSSPSSEAKSGVITLSDWGVQFVVPESLKTTGVEYAQQNTSGAAEYGFTTSRIKALGGDCEKEPYGKPVVLNRSKNAPQGMDGFVLINNEPVGGYYYSYKETIPACSGNISDPTAKVSDIEIQEKQYVATLLKTLKSI